MLRHHFAQSALQAVKNLEEANEGMWQSLAPDPDGFWRDYEEIVKWPRPTTVPLDLTTSEVIIGFLGRCHLGDIICSSALVRKLKVEFGLKVYMARHRGTYKVFENNPYLDGFKNENHLSLNVHAIGLGHIIQKLQRSFALSLDPFPSGDLFFSDEELEWAFSLRSLLPRNRPVALISAQALTDNLQVPTYSLPWQSWVGALAKTHTVVQIAVTQLATVEESVRLGADFRRAWNADQIFDNVFVVENPTTRHFFSLFTLADFFLGPNSGAAHVSAALNIPSVVVLPKKKYPESPAFPDLNKELPWKHQAFLYPQHSFLVEI